MRSRLVAIFLILNLSLVWQAPAQGSTIRGKSCAKSGVTKTVSGVKYVCKKSGDRLVWQRAPRPATSTTSPTPTSTPTPTASKTVSENAMLSATAGCGNSVALSALTKKADIETERLIATGASNVQLIPLDSKQRPDRILIQSFNCSTSARSLYEVTVGKKSTSEKLPDFDPGWTLIDAGYDPPRDAPLALVRDSSWNYQVLLRTGLSWTLIWQSSLTRLQTYVDTLQTATGYEFYLYGDRQNGGGWNRIRVMKDGSTYVDLRGTTSMRSGASSILGQVDSYITRSGIWICEPLLPHTDLPTGSNDRCTIIAETAGKSGVFALAEERNSYWFLYSTDSLISATYAVKIDCGADSRLSFCARPKIATPSPKRVTGYRQNLVWMWIGDMEFLSLSAVSLG